MTETNTGLAEYDDAAVARIHAFVEQVTGGKIVCIERQIRWRPAWFADVETDGTIVQLHLRGDRAGDVAIFPDLKREADIIEVLGAHGVPVPKIYGYLADPPCIVMESIAGTRDLSGLTEGEKGSVGREYMAAVAAMHAVPLEAFARIGIHAPESAEDIALVGLNAYLPQYVRTKRRPEPLLEFVIGWLRRNVPKHRNKASFVQFDSGQFLVADGKLTKLYDFEFGMIGDPFVDIATMGMRNSIEPLGASLAELCRNYETSTGEPVDHDVILFHILQFSTLGTMQFTGTVAEPVPGDPHSVYVEWDLSLRKSMLLALSALTGVALPVLEPLTERTGNNAALIAKLVDTVARITPAAAIDEAQKAQAAQLIEALARVDAVDAEAVARDIADVSGYLGQELREWSDAAAALEAHIQAAGAEEDAALIKLLGTIEGRRMQVYQPTAIAGSARDVVLPKTR